MQEVFAVAVIETFDPNLGEQIPSDKDIEESFSDPGAVFIIDEMTQHNLLAFFISTNECSCGIGYKNWKAIEEKYAETKV